jgi:hypothetical protein
LANVPSGTAGAVLAVKFDSASADYNFLEACNFYLIFIHKNKFYF